MGNKEGDKLIRIGGIGSGKFELYPIGIHARMGKPRRNKFYLTDVTRNVVICAFYYELKIRKEWIIDPSRSTEFKNLSAKDMTEIAELMKYLQDNYNDEGELIIHES